MEQPKVLKWIVIQVIIMINIGGDKGYLIRLIYDQQVSNGKGKSLELKKGAKILNFDLLSEHLNTKELRLQQR